ncbi:MAG TPA: hypothetical protein QGH56_02545, partial [Candidatus Marinimicrobia bacterium]|nr:hypothetical protein [Candidatus Neomarinimicrobiota bacterium]
MRKLYHILFILFFSIGLSDQPDWSINPSNFQFNASMTGVLIFNGEESTDSNDIIAAFVGDECRGVKTDGILISGKMVFGLTIFGNENGESLTFKAYDASNDQVNDNIDFTYSFVSNDIVGSAEDPVEWNFITLLLGDPDFFVTITANADDVNYELTFGFASDATDGYDDGIDQYAPPAPPPPAFDAALSWGGDRYYTQIVNGSEDDLVEHEWDIQIAYPASNQVTLEWDSEFMVGLGTFILQDAFGGMMINVDMTQEGSVDLTNPAFTTLKIKVTPSGESPPPEETQVTFTVIDDGNDYTNVALKGQMTGWGNVPMNNDGSGTWTLTLALESGGYEWGAVAISDDS